MSEKKTGLSARIAAMQAAEEAAAKKSSTSKKTTTTKSVAKTTSKTTAAKTSAKTTAKTTATKTSAKTASASAKKTTATAKATSTAAVKKTPSKTITAVKSASATKASAAKTTVAAKTTTSAPAKTTAAAAKSKTAKAPASPAVYDEDSIQHLEGLEHIRLRPGMYIGSLGDGSNENDGIYILLKEGIDNSVDEFSQGFGKKIDIEIKDGRVKIRDYGRGIPLGKLEDCVSNVNTGAKYNNNVFKQAIGMNGVGIKATNALSSYFRAASIRDGKMAVVEFQKGEKISGKTGAAKPGVPNGTYLEFEPDTELFGKYNFNMEYVEKRLWNYAYLNPGLLLKCNGQEYISQNGIQDLLVNEMDGEGKALYKIFSYKGENLEFVLTHTNSLDKFVYSFVNGQSTEDGGTHVTSFLDGVTKGVNSFFKKEYDEKDVCGGLICALKIGLDNPMFTSQTKNKLGNVEIRAPIIKEVQAAVDDWLRHNPDVAGALEEKIIKNQKARNEINSVTEKQIREAEKSVMLKIQKLKDCRYHLQDGEKGANSMIFITEGDSATGSMVGSRDVSYQAIFSLRGKPENMYGRKKSALFENEELKNLTFSLGVQKDIEGLRYDKIIIATDADNDGFHIRNLVMTYLLLFFEELVLTGHVYILETPLFRVRNKTKTVYCYSEESRDKELAKMGKSAEVTRFKGLGEINPSEFGQFIFPRKEGESEDKGMHLTQVTIQSLKNVPQVLKFYMGNNTPERRDFIVHNLAKEIDA
ncbi:topoisomerase-4 subunit B [Treponema bryantii]|uniref:DNA topoisomerase (ATP-hydrolyzing) n=1 Tax=Treponema bryantii TaxID=163 RepID=A0A1H8ZYM8_9SPIR|nr:toprim domain-containing protein [Treponema bryantii]SEP69494.1 topoisomerase-4 subunit B [Treponema bryantii]